MSKLGYCSRARAVELVRAGKVMLNGTKRRDPEYPVRIEKDHIQVEGEEIKREDTIYLMMNKPRGIVTTASDEKGRVTIYGLLTTVVPWVSPVGRLDKASEGLLFLTNDTEWGAQITSPKTHLPKVYHVQVKGELNEAKLEILRAGTGSESEILRARKISVIRRGERNTWLEVTLDEGKNRHIRRMLQAIGADILRLIRISIGPQCLGDLAKGAWRPLTHAEKSALDLAVNGANQKLSTG